MEFEDKYKEYIIDKLGRLMKSMANRVKSQKEKMSSEGGEQKTEKIKENTINFSRCGSLTGEIGAECIMSQMVSAMNEFIDWMEEYENMMGTTNKAQLKNESLKIRKNGKVINLTESDLQKIVKRTLNEGIVHPNSSIEKIVKLGNKGSTIKNVTWEKEGEEVVGIRVNIGSYGDFIIKK